MWGVYRRTRVFLLILYVAVCVIVAHFFVSYHRTFHVAPSSAVDVTQPKIVDQLRRREVVLSTTQISVDASFTKHKINISSSVSPILVFQSSVSPLPPVVSVSSAAANVVVSARHSPVKKTSDDTARTYVEPLCPSCPRPLPPTSAGKRTSTCGEYSTARGPHQKVVSYSYFGKLSNTLVYNKYFKEIKQRASDISVKYPSWIMRIYHNISTADVGTKLSLLCDVYCSSPHVDLCDVTRLPAPACDVTKKPITSGTCNLQVAFKSSRAWRFMAMVDPLVDIFVSRDLDSYILDREVAAVREWLQSNFTFHFMRDHPSHNGYILAGLWGVKVSHHRPLLMSMMKEMIEKKYRATWDFDQALLRRVVFPRAYFHAMTHDSYFCFTNSVNLHRPRPFPTQRKNREFLGWGPTKDPEKDYLVPCPKECRPPQHPDWHYC